MSDQAAVHIVQHPFGRVEFDGLHQARVGGKSDGVGEAFSVFRVDSLQYNQQLVVLQFQDFLYQTIGAFEGEL
nr:hypothetical protein [Bacillota bacterium]